MRAPVNRFPTTSRLRKRHRLLPRIWPAGRREERIGFSWRGRIGRRTADERATPGGRQRAERTSCGTDLRRGVGGGRTTAGRTPPADPPPIVIRPQKAGNPLPPAPAKGGAIIIRPQAAAPPAQPAGEASPEAGRSLFDYWFVASVEGERIGYLHWSAREIEKDGRKLHVGTKYQKLTIGRFGQVVSQWGEEGSTETPEGEVLVTTMGQGIGKDQALALTGVVEGKVLKVTGAGAAAAASDTPWPGGVTGVVREPALVRERRLKPGESLDYLTYVGSLNRVVKTTTTAEAEETAALWPGTKPRTLLRVVSRMEPVGNFRLPASYLWCDATTYEPLKVEFDFPGLGGRVTFLRTTRAAATAPVGKVPDLFNAQSIRLDREVPNIHSRLSVTYRVTMPRDDDPGTAFATDARQKVENLDAKAKSFDLAVTAVRGPVPSDAPPAAADPQFLGSSFFINWDNDPVKAHAAKAAARLPAGASAWDKARAVERWVKENMKAVEFSQAMATADNVAKTLSGDCTEYAMLAAAMCRAVGSSIADGARARVRERPRRRQAASGLPHVVRGARRRPVAGPGRHAGPGKHRPRPREDHRPLVARGAVVRAAPAGVAGADGEADVRGGAVRTINHSQTTPASGGRKSPSLGARRLPGIRHCAGSLPSASDRLGGLTSPARRGDCLTPSGSTHAGVVKEVPMHNRMKFVCRMDSGPRTVYTRKGKALLCGNVRGGRSLPPASSLRPGRAQPRVESNVPMRRPPSYRVMG